MMNSALCILFIIGGFSNIIMTRHVQKVQMIVMIHKLHCPVRGFHKSHFLTFDPPQSTVLKNTIASLLIGRAMEGTTLMILVSF